MATRRIQSFTPLADENAVILILGSMPGTASLEARQYYAHQRNSFWRIMQQLLRMEPEATYEQRVQTIKDARIAVWDVLQSCVREGSLDARIEQDTQTANDFHSFFLSHAHITHVFFNGAKAEACFNQHVLQQLRGRSLDYLRLPSTSPANASTSYAMKLEKWRAILPPLNL